MSVATTLIEAPAIETKHGNFLAESTLRSFVDRVIAFWRERRQQSAELKRSQSVSAAVNRKSNELRREQHICTALMHP
jgi:hypothetical protein